MDWNRYLTYRKPTYTLLYHSEIAMPEISAQIFENLNMRYSEIVDNGKSSRKHIEKANPY